ncbi:FAD-dependent monooxygenase (plasmid) [Nitrobacteraceae bacterium UC4446_H13]
MARRGPEPTLDSLILVDLPRWSKGRVILLGDSAHCLTLVSGQGARMAIASAELLARALARTSVAEAFRQHDASLRPAINRLQLGPSSYAESMAGTISRKCCANQGLTYVVLNEKS